MALPEGVAEAILQSNRALADTLAGAFQNLKLQRQSTVKLNKFSGFPVRSCDQTVVEWLRDVDTYARQVGVSEYEKVNVAFDHLIGDAREEVMCTPHNMRDTWPKLESLLTRRFGAPETVQSLTSALYSRSQLPDESLADYSRTLIRLHDKMEAAATDERNKNALAQLRDGTLREQFVRGVGDPTLRRDLRKLSFDHGNLPFFQFRELVLGLYSQAEGIFRAESEAVNHAPFVNSARASKPVGMGEDKLDLLIEGQSKLITAVQKMVDQQSQMSTKLHDVSQSLASLKVERSADKGSRNWTPPKCSYCQKPGHAVENCFRRQRVEARKSDHTNDNKLPVESENDHPLPPRAV